MNSLRSKVAVTMALALAVTLVAVSPAGAHPGPWPAKKPTVVLVHGAFADSSGFSGIVERLQAAGYPVVAAANPLRSLAADAASIRALLDTVDGPIILVAHSYGGNVISAAATGRAEPGDRGRSRGGTVRLRPLDLPAVHPGPGPAGSDGCRTPRRP
jgi:pimeloyl-ACP methyl ester carboxylesterase